MFDALLSRLITPEPQPLNDTDCRLALGALMVRLARADGIYNDYEVAHIEHVFMTRYGLSADDATKLRGEAEVLESEAPDTVRFTRAIKDAVPHEERTQVMEALWQVALSDGRGHEEDALMRLVAPMLGINDRDSALARQRVETKLGL
ncbi:MAG: TerB family tellurite resistance protein [Silicimonas sp.]|nr:TerB family tellurite resistance protein [Silicimonas sp.]